MGRLLPGPRENCLPGPRWGWVRDRLPAPVDQRAGIQPGIGTSVICMAQQFCKMLLLAPALHASYDLQQLRHDLLPDGGLTQLLGAGKHGGVQPPRLVGRCCGQRLLLELGEVLSDDGRHELAEQRWVLSFGLRVES